VFLWKIILQVFDYKLVSIGSTVSQAKREKNKPDRRFGSGGGAGGGDFAPGLCSSKGEISPRFSL
jgi:pantothenate kinase